MSAAAPSVQALVVGDAMLDAYISGQASRISPEAPVPVVSVSQRRYLPGGAANVAANIRALGAKVSLGGVVGDDDSGNRLRRVIEELGIGQESLITDRTRITTTKSRVTAGQQIVRFDDEDSSPLHEDLAARLRVSTAESLANANVCVISDYAKGLIEPSFCRWLIERAAQRGIPIVVDPKALDFSRYRGATVITPNLKEAAAAAREPIQSDLDLAQAVTALFPVVSPSALLITRGERGMTLFEPGKPGRHLPAVVNEVADVTGAGDTVVAALAVALAAGIDLPDAAAIANIAAGVKVSHHGTWAVTAEELRAAESRNPDTHSVGA
ncbi:MAG TPA: D-glycero-beta-D-manno-heptose-7-phosphate kinase [Bryobacteraceae bacterium]|nr:D-glycero-beta-D-manno-heptose-7-phosphate kinase [Bryobacteraceae bacterium]